MGQAKGTTAEIILFDLGGVLMDFSGLHRLAEITGQDNDASLRERWVSSPWPQAFELGRCTGDEFAAGVVADWDLDLTGAEFLAEFASWPAGPFDGAVDLVRSLSGQVAMGCMSNTNPAHWQQHLETWGVVQYFDWTFVSHELGMMKPDPEVYEHVVRTIGLSPERILFLDDWEDNVAAAADHGICSVLVRGIDEVRAAISQSFPDLVVADKLA